MKRTKILTVNSILNFLLFTELSEILWSFQKVICAHASRRATAASKAKGNITM